MSSARLVDRYAAMRVSDVMQAPPITVGSNDDANLAWERMREHKIRHLVVLGDDAAVVGVIAEHDLSGPHGGGARRMGRHVVDLMHRDGRRVTPATPIARAARLLRESSTHCLPVCARGKLVGVVTASDLLRVLEAR